LGSTIGDNTFREAVKLPDMVKKESGCSFRCNRCVRRNKVYSLGDGIHDGHDGVMSRRLREFDYKIDTKGVPSCVQNREWLELTNRRMSPRFGLETKIASTHILADVPRHLGPPVVPGH